MTTIVQFLPKWLRLRLRKPTEPKPKTVSKKDRQVLPMVAKPLSPPDQLDDDGAPLKFRVYWRM